MIKLDGQVKSFTQSSFQSDPLRQDPTEIVVAVQNFSQSVNLATMAQNGDKVDFTVDGHKCKGGIITSMETEPSHSIVTFLCDMIEVDISKKQIIITEDISINGEITFTDSTTNKEFVLVPTSMSVTSPFIERGRMDDNKAREYWRTLIAHGYTRKN